MEEKNAERRSTKLCRLATKRSEGFGNSSSEKNIERMAGFLSEL